MGKKHKKKKKIDFFILHMEFEGDIYTNMEFWLKLH